MTTNACCVWDYTIPHDAITLADLLAWCKENCKKYCFQHEKGETGYEHWQCRFSLKERKRIPPKPCPKAHSSVTSKENWENEFYVLKSASRISGPWTDRDLYIPRQARNIILRPWQQQIVDDATVWDTRHLNVLYCPKGNIGKSILVAYACSRGLARKIPIMDSYKDMMRFVMDTPPTSLYLVDFPRALNRSCCGSFWGALETIKDGYQYDDRYKFRDEWRDCPNIWVFSNDKPDPTLLSPDRWYIWELDEGTGVLRRACNT